MVAEPTDKVCRKCGIPQPLERFPFRKVEQSYRGTCKACRAAESRALRNSPELGQRIRDREKVRNRARQEDIKRWKHEHPDNMRPGQQRRSAWANERHKARRAVLRAQREALAYRPLLGPFRAVLPPKKRGRPPGGGRGSKSLGAPSATP